MMVFIGGRIGIVVAALLFTFFLGWIIGDETATRRMIKLRKRDQKMLDILTGMK
jgi:hypothetical protein